MVRYFPFLFAALIQLTDLTGKPVYIAPQAVADVSLSFNGARPEGATQIRTYGGTYFVLEDPAVVARKIRDEK